MKVYFVHFGFPSYADDREFYAGIDSDPFLYREHAEEYMKDVLDGKVMVSYAIPNSGSICSVDIIENYTPSNEPSRSEQEYFESMYPEENNDFTEQCEFIESLLC